MKQKKASIWERIFSFILDIIFLSAFFFPITYLYSGKWLMYPEDHLWSIFDPICLIFLIIIFLYFVILEAYFGQTVGKKIMKINVVDYKDNKRIGIKKSLIRNLLRLVDGLPAFNLLGLFLIIYTKNHQRFGDMIAKTFVIKLENRLK
ncbi:MAG: RDD family protein [archaeon]